MNVWERIRRGEDVTLGEVVRAVVEDVGSVPDDPPAAEVQQKRPRGRPPKWTDRDIGVINAIVSNARLLSEAETTDLADMRCSPLSMEEIRRRVGAMLRRPMEGKSLENLLRRRSGPKGFVRYTSEDFRRVFKEDPPS